MGGRHLVVIGGWHGQFVNDVYVLDTVISRWALKASRGEMRRPRWGDEET